MVVAVLAATAYRRLVLFELGVEGYGEDQSPVPGIAVEQLDETGAEEYRTLRPDTSLEEFRDRLAAGDWCLVTRREGRIVRALWVSRGTARSPYLRCELPLADDEVYIHDMFTARDGRGRDLGRAVRGVLGRRLREEGYRALLALVLLENRPAVGMVRKQGYRPVALVATLTIGSRRWIFRRPPPRSLRGLNSPA